MIGTERLRFNYAKILLETEEKCTVEVSLSFAQREIQTMAEGNRDDKGRLKATATATLEGVRAAIGQHFNCKLADLDHVYALGKNLIAVLVDIDFEDKHAQVFGSCQILSTEMDAAAKAALNATNRFVELAIRTARKRQMEG